MNYPKRASFGASPVGIDASVSLMSDGGLRGWKRVLTTFKLALVIPAYVFLSIFCVAEEAVSQGTVEDLGDLTGVTQSRSLRGTVTDEEGVWYEFRVARDNLILAVDRRNYVDTDICIYRGARPPSGTLEEFCANYPDSAIAFLNTSSSLGGELPLQTAGTYYMRIVRGLGTFAPDGNIRDYEWDYWISTPGVELTRTNIALEEGDPGKRSASYQVRLNSQPAGTVTVRAVSADPEAVTVSPETLTFGSDYRRLKTFTVTASDDLDMDGESVTITHRVTGYGDVTDGGTVTVTVADVEATDTVRERPGPAEKKLVEDIVESVASGSLSNVTANIGTRFSAARGGVTLALGGRTATFDQDASSLSERKTGRQATPGRGSGGESWSRGFRAEELLRSSAFELPFGADEDGTQADPVQWTLWGRGDVLFFDSRPDNGPRYDGDLGAGYLGIDAWLDDRWLAGVAISRTRVDTKYDRTGGGGRLEMALTGVHPYVRFAPDAGSELWAILGAGRGEIEHRRRDAPGRQTSDAAMYMAAAGVRQALATGDRVAWALLGDAGFGRLNSDSGPDLIDGLSVDAWRARLGVEGSAPFGLEGGSSLTPFVEFAGRYDGGSDSDVGLEIAAGAHYADPASGFGVEARGRALALHSADDYREYGASLTASLSPGADGEGLSLSLSPQLGAAAGGADALWRENAYAGSSHGQAMSLDARIGYGLRAVAARGVLTPFGEFGLRERGGRDMRAGVRFNRAGSAPSALSVELSAARRDGGGRGPEHRANLIGRLQF